MNDVSWLGPAIDVRPLFAKQQAAWIELLRRLDDEDWQRSTICPGWSVKDVAAHVLGDHAGRLARQRDGFPAPRPRAGEAFPAFIDRINAEWVTAARRLSPPLLVELLTLLGDQIVAFWRTVDMSALGERVYWAGPEPAPVWLDAARDFSEYWTHHQQICDATGHPGLTGPEYLAPVIDTFLRALPHTLREVHAPSGATIAVTVTGPAGGTWTCTRGQERWVLRRQAGPHPDPDDPDARLTLDADTTWRLCTRGITPDQAARRARVEGDQRLAAACLDIVSIIWSPQPTDDA
jgi:uncharacterized protein (TIGR03083 family)